MNLEESEFYGKPFLYIRIRDAECYSSNTESSFEVYICAMDYENNFLSSVGIQSDRFRKESGVRIFEGFVPTQIRKEKTIDECFEKVSVNQI
ncbi:hypothetical protein OESDEN_01764 [Oesophagostomum dentatum]|uniref:Uncharacterized protein n=1 Tax=Oesophagostomum dentatum TaxID=61180 RepID=A0A0B1TLY6_OESDE|nr:hypothetical protein OESDEN_01764 [Oesophagostomum dentatum]